MKDLIVIGGGASGVATAIMAKKENPNLAITILEKNDRILKKLAVTGNGRCNILNKKIAIDNYHGTGKDLAISLINRFDINQQELFFESLGTPIIYEENKGFPMSKQATSVVDCLRFSANELGIETVLNSTVTDIKKENGVFKITTENETFIAQSVLVSCGSVAGGKLGSESGYSLLKGLGHKILERYAAIVQIKTDKTYISALKGIKVNANCSILVDNEVKRTEYGEVLFCDYGLSGPPILQLSRIASKNKKSVISIDFFNEFSLSDLKLILEQRKITLKSREISEFFTGMINKRLGQTIIKRCNISLSDTVDKLTNKDIENISYLLKNYTIKTNGTTGMANAQVAAGGADAREFDDNLMSKKVSGLFATGEVLDIDGDCGGYNLAYCWAAASAASNGINLYLGKLK